MRMKLFPYHPLRSFTRARTRTHRSFPILGKEGKTPRGKKGLSHMLSKFSGSHTHPCQIQSFSALEESVAGFEPVRKSGTFPAAVQMIGWFT